MELKDYSTEELWAEIKRRATGERCQRSIGRSRKAEYAYAKAEITFVSDESFSRRIFRGKIDPNSVLKFNGRWLSERPFFLLRANFTKDTAPKVGDIVRLRSRKTKSNPDGFGLFSSAQIFEIIKRAGN